MSSVEGSVMITGVGQRLGEQVISNDQLIAMTGIDSNAAWIETRTGIQGRRWVAEGTHASDLGASAAEAALRMANARAAEVSGIYLSTTTPDYLSPSTATLVHEKLDAPENCMAIDLRAACAGGVLGLKLAANCLQSEQDPSKALVIGTNVMSTIINREDRTTVILFGDGAGAVVLEPRPGAHEAQFAVLTQPNKDAIHIPGGGTVEPSDITKPVRATIHMNGPEVKRHAIDIMTRSTEQVAAQAGIYDSAEGVDWSAIDYFVPHQANARLIDAVGENLEVPSEKCIVTIAEQGNTSAGSIFIALAEAHQRGDIKPGRNRILFTAVGAGFVGGAALIDVELS